jgi:hypothetical protein
MSRLKLLKWTRTRFCLAIESSMLQNDLVSMLQLRESSAHYNLVRTYTYMAMLELWGLVNDISGGYMKAQVRYGWELGLFSGMVQTMKGLEKSMKGAEQIH